jgi:CRP-like cAMP-binding protein
MSWNSPAPSKAPVARSRTAPPHPWRGSAASLCTTCTARAVSVCDAVADDDLDRLMEATVRFACEAGRTFVTEGDAADHFFNITSGVARLSKLPMTRTDIGDYLGLTIETVSRGFSQLRAEGAIALPKPGAVRLLDRQFVEAAAGEPVGAG